MVLQSITMERLAGGAHVTHMALCQTGDWDRAAGGLCGSMPSRQRHIGCLALQCFHS